MSCIKIKWNIFLVAILTCHAISCTIADNDHPVISDLENTECQVNANNLFSSIKMIKLETSDNCLLSAPSLIDFCDDGIFIWDKNIVYRFDNKGNFINRIGKIGHGYGEYTGVTSINYDKKHKNVYIGTFSNDIYKYNVKGDYIGKFHVSGGNDILLTSRWSEALGLYVCETRNYRSNGLDVKLTTWTLDGKQIASYPIYSDNESVDRNFTRTGSIVDTDDGILFRLPFYDTIYKLSQNGLTKYTIIDRGRHTPTRNMVEDNSLESKLEKESYYINHWNVTQNYIYMTVACYRGYRNVIVRLSDNRTIHNQYYSYQEDDGTHNLRLKGLHCKATFWPWISKGDKVAGLVRNDDKSRNPILVIATEKKVSASNKN